MSQGSTVNGSGVKIGNTSGLDELAVIDKSSLKDPGTGIVLVFDLDQTLVDSSNINFPFDVIKTLELLSSNPSLVNQRLMNTIMFTAAVLRESYYVSAILMLTNNSSAEYIAGVCKYIYKEIKQKFKKLNIPITTITKGMYGNTQAESEGIDVTKLPEKDYFFDYIMTRLSKKRSGNSTNPSKSLKDIKNMLNNLGKSTENLESRVFMFDDKTDHIISKELNPIINYIVVKSKDKTTGENIPFHANLEETTDYNPIKGIFSGLFYKSKIRNLSSELNNTINNLNIKHCEKELSNKIGGKRKFSSRYNITRSKKSKSRPIISYYKRKTRNRKRKQRGAGEKCIVYGPNGSIKNTWDCGAACNYEGTDRCRPYE